MSIELRDELERRLKVVNAAIFDSPTPEMEAFGMTRILRYLGESLINTSLEGITGEERLSLLMQAVEDVMQVTDPDFSFEIREISERPRYLNS